MHLTGKEHAIFTIVHMLLTYWLTKRECETGGNCQGLKRWFGQKINTHVRCKLNCDIRIRSYWIFSSRIFSFLFNFSFSIVRISQWGVDGWQKWIHAGETSDILYEYNTYYTYAYRQLIFLLTISSHQSSRTGSLKSEGSEKENVKG